MYVPLKNFENILKDFNWPMPKRADIPKILFFGSDPNLIGLSQRSTR